MTALPATHAPSAPAMPQARASDLDIARAIGIALVVAGHALIGVERALGETIPGRAALILIYAVHMPLFFFLSGLLAHRALTEPGPAFAHRLLTRFAWPYLVWSLVLLGFHHAFSDLTNTRVPTPNPLRILWSPPSVMWFLYVLAPTLALARVLIGTTPRRLAGAALLLAGTVLADHPDTWLLPFLRFTGIFLLATTVPPATRHAATHPAALALATLALASGAALALAEATHPLTGYPAAHLRYLPASAGGVALCLAAGAALARGPLGHPLAALGRRTLPIFLTHILVLAALRIVLLHAGLHDRALILAIVVPAGLLLPLAAALIAERLGLSRPLGWS